MCKKISRWASLHDSDLYSLTPPSISSRRWFCIQCWVLWCVCRLWEVVGYKVVVVVTWDRSRGKEHRRRRLLHSRRVARLVKECQAHGYWLGVEKLKKLVNGVNPKHLGVLTETTLYERCHGCKSKEKKMVWLFNPRNSLNPRLCQC